MNTYCLFFSSNLDSLVIKTMERHFSTLSECPSNILITGGCKSVEKNGHVIFNWSQVHSKKNKFLKNPYFNSPPIPSSDLPPALHVSIAGPAKLKGVGGLAGTCSLTPSFLLTEQKEQQQEFYTSMPLPLKLFNLPESLVSLLTCSQLSYIWHHKLWFKQW